MVDALGFALLSADVAIYALLALQLLWSARGGARGTAIGVSEAFALLGAEVRRSVPGVPPGFTWEEAIEGARRLKVDVDWRGVYEAVKGYEGYRYGGRAEPAAGYEEILRLARELRRAR